MRFGTLKVVCGCMFSGKSTELARMLRIASIAMMRVFAFKPKIDTRDSGAVRSRDGQTHQAVTVDWLGEILSAVPEHGPGLVGIDEAQFFSAEIVTVVERLRRRGFNVACAGLDTDFRGEPFGPMPQLLAVADEVIKLKAVCMQCRDVNATRSQRLIDAKPAPYDAPIVLVGGEESYEARCASCHEVPHAIEPDPPSYG